MVLIIFPKDSLSWHVPFLYPFTGCRNNCEFYVFHLTLQQEHFPLLTMFLVDSIFYGYITLTCVIYAIIYLTLHTEDIRKHYFLVLYALSSKKRFAATFKLISETYVLFRIVGREKPEVPEVIPRREDILGR